MNEAASRDVAIVTPWYPSRELPFRGAFVQAMVDATAPGCDNALVYHCDTWVSRMDQRTTDAVEAANRTLAPLAVRPTPTVGGAQLVHLAVTTPRSQEFGPLARNHERQLRAALGGNPIAAPVVHAHVGLPGAWAALQNARPDARVFVTEHATYLDRVLAEPDARALYDEVLHRVDGFFAVGEPIRDVLTAAFPHHAEKIQQIPNPISFREKRAVPVTELRRWLFLGGLIPRKGVDLLVEAFAQCHAKDPELTLTMVGEGELRAQLTARAAELGLEDAIRFLGAVPPDAALNLMREHDLLVHPSRYETFGMTVVEAVAAGMPVLVTRCGGPEETLAGIESVAGEMIDVEDNPESITDGYWRLRDRFDRDVDLELAQKTLDGRYGYEAVAEAHYRLWFPAATHNQGEDSERAGTLE